LPHNLLLSAKKIALEAYNNHFFKKYQVI
jgi:hypothetical protein